MWWQSKPFAWCGTPLATTFSLVSLLLLGPALVPAHVVHQVQSCSHTASGTPLPPFWTLSLPLDPALPLLSPTCDPSLCPNSGSSHLPHSPKSSQSGFCVGMPIPLLLHVILNMYFFLAGAVSLITINE